MAKRKTQKHQQVEKKSPVDAAAAFISKNLYRHRHMTVQDGRITPWDMRDSLIKEDPGNLYEIKSTIEGDVISVNKGEATIYVGNSAFGDKGHSAVIVDDFIRGEILKEGSSTYSPFVTIALIGLVVLIIIVAVL